MRHWRLCRFGLAEWAGALDGGGVGCAAGGWTREADCARGARSRGRGVSGELGRFGAAGRRRWAIFLCCLTLLHYSNAYTGLFGRSDQSSRIHNCTFGKSLGGAFEAEASGPSLGSGESYSNQTDAGQVTFV